MRDSETDKDSLADTESAEPVRIWIETEEGSIARGVVEVLSENSALVRLTGAAVVASGNDVTVRIAFSRDSPTLGGAARVRWVGPEAHDSECELDWTHSGPERDQLACIVVSSS